MYPPESNHLDSLDELSKSNVDFLAAYVDSAICGIGAVKVLSDYGEIKRLYVPEKHRGKGIAKEIVEELESCLASSSRLSNTPRYSSSLSRLQPSPG